MRRIYFNNSNSESIIKWILRKNDTLEQVVFYFLSQTNITSPRYFPLFNASTKIRIVYLNGLIIPYTDLLMLKLYKLIFNLLKPKFEKYNCIHLTRFFSSIKFFMLNLNIINGF